MLTGKALEEAVQELGFLVQDPESIIRKRLVVKAEGRILFLSLEEVRWLEAEGNYIRIHADLEQQHIIRYGISSLEKELDSSVFLRISRSVIVNIQYVREMQPWFRGNYRVLMSDGTELTLTGNYRDRLNNFIGIPLGTRSPSV